MRIIYPPKKYTYLELEFKFFLYSLFKFYSISTQISLKKIFFFLGGYKWIKKIILLRLQSTESSEEQKRPYFLESQRWIEIRSVFQLPTNHHEIQVLPTHRGWQMLCKQKNNTRENGIQRDKVFHQNLQHETEPLVC